MVSRFQWLIRGARQVALQAVGIIAGVVLVGALEYSLFGIWSGVLMTAPLAVMLAVLWVTATARAHGHARDDVSIP
jgi:hypothetical protein